MWAPSPRVRSSTTSASAARSTVEDQFGNLETGFDGSVTIALDSQPQQCGLGGTTTVTASGGVATFSGLTINNVGNGYTLMATGDGLTSPASTPINVTPIPPSN